MLRFPATVDGQFITKPVDELFRNAELLKIPFITGVNNDEGGWLLPTVRLQSFLPLSLIEVNCFRLVLVSNI